MKHTAASSFDKLYAQYHRQDSTYLGLCYIRVFFSKSSIFKNNAAFLDNFLRLFKSDIKGSCYYSYHGFNTIIRKWERNGTIHAIETVKWIRKWDDAGPYNNLGSGVATLRKRVISLNVCFRLIAMNSSVLVAKRLADEISLTLIFREVGHNSWI